MLSKRDLDRIAGALMLAIVAAIIGTFVSEIEVDTARSEFRQTLQDIVDDRGMFLAGAAFDMASNLITVFFAGAVYLVFRSHERSLALFAAFGLLAASSVFLVANGLDFPLYYMAQDFVAASGAEANSIASTARALALFELILESGGITLIGLGMVSLGVLIVRTEALPRWLGWLPVAGGTLLVLGWVGFVEEVLFIIGFVGFGIIMLFLLIAGGWLIARGTREAT